MTKVTFFEKTGQAVGFSVRGHSTESCDDETGKLVCAAVSSAVYMAANTVTEVCRETADIRVEDGLMVLRLAKPPRASASVLNGLRLHLAQLAAQYPTHLTITTEV